MRSESLFYFKNKPAFNKQMDYSLARQSSVAGIITYCSRLLPSTPDFLINQIQLKQSAEFMLRDSTLQKTHQCPQTGSSNRLQLAHQAPTAKDQLG
jgi:hypothetical protein